MKNHRCNWEALAVIICRRHVITLLMSISLFTLFSCQSSSPSESGTSAGTASLSGAPTFKKGFERYPSFLIAWWNVENLFDTVDDPTDDNEFLPNSKRNWTEERLAKKIERLSQVIRDIGKSRGKKLPEIMGFCEVEHQSLLERLFEDGLKTKSYRYVYYESGDTRGIDVGIAYDTTVFKLVSAAKYRVDLGKGERPTRDIVRASLSYKGKVLHYICNHWPSRLGGQERSAPKRVIAAKVLRAIVDSLYTANPAEDIVIMGDFNDSPKDISILEVLNTAVTYSQLRAAASGEPKKIPLFNYARDYPGNGQVKGSIIFSNQWELIDLCLISKGMTDSIGFFSKEDLPSDDVDARAFNIFQEDYLFESAKEGGRSKLRDLFRTYGSGSKYLGGYADHLPIYLELFFRP